MVGKISGLKPSPWLSTKNKSSPFSPFDADYYRTGHYHTYKTNQFGESAIIVDQVIASIKEKITSALDIGCGLGGTIAALRRHQIQASGVEISPYIISQSPVKAHIHLASVLNLPFPDKSFDVSFAIQVLYYVAQNDLSRALHEIKRVTRSYAYLDIITQDSPNADQTTNPDSARDNANLYPKKELETMLKNFGFTFYDKIAYDFEDPDLIGIYKISP